MSDATRFHYSDTAAYPDERDAAHVPVAQASESIPAGGCAPPIIAIASAPPVMAGAVTEEIMAAEIVRLREALGEIVKGARMTSVGPVQRFMAIEMIAADALTAALSVAAGRPDGKSDPDFIYTPDDWECTYVWADRHDLLKDVTPNERDEIRQYATLLHGPAKFAAYVVTERDEEGEELDGEWRWFDSLEAAEIARVAPPALTGEKQ